MAKKPKITTVKSGYLSNEQLTSNFNNISDAFENTVSRDGSTPNSMSADLDVNGNRVINHAAPVNDSDLVTKGYADKQYGNLDEIKDLAQQVEDDAAQVAADKDTVEAITNAVPSGIENFVGDGLQTVFTVSAFTIVDSLSVLVVTSGGLQLDTDDYSISGQDITFVVAPTGAFEVRYIGTSVQADITADAFKTVSVSGQGDVVAVGEDSLNLVAGTDIQLTTTPVSNEVTITYNGTSAESLNDLTDVVITAPSDDEFLRYNGVGWVNESITLADIPGDTADITEAADHNYVTDAEKTVLGNTTGINTGDQTITLTGPVTGSGTGTFATEISDGSVGFTKLESLQGASLLGRGGPTSGNPEEITLGSTMIMNGTVLDVNPAAGVGDVLGPASSTDNALVRYDGTTGKIIQNSNATLTDTGDLTLAGTVSTATITNLDKRYANHSTTGLLKGGKLSPNVDTTKYDIEDGNGVVVDAYTDPDNPTYTEVSWSGLTAQVVTTPAALTTYVAINSAGTVVTQNTRFTIEQERDLITLGLIVTADGVNVTNTNSRPHLITGEPYIFHDYISTIGVLNNDGNAFTPAATNLTIKKTAGTETGDSLNYDSSTKSANTLTSAEIDPVTFIYAYSNGAGGSTIVPSQTALNPVNYDDGTGVLATVANNKFTNQLWFWFSNLNLVIAYYGQTTYNTLEEAKADALSFDWDNHLSLGFTGARTVITTKKEVTDLTSPTEAFFTNTGLFGYGSVGTGSGGAVQTLQSVYDVSNINPEILTNSTNGALCIRAGTGLDTDTLFCGQNGVGTETFSFDGNGDVTANTLTLTSNLNLGGNNIISGGSGSFTGGLTAATLNTGQGANELYAMNQDVETTDSVTFNSLSLTNDLAITEGGTGASDAATALSNLGGIGAATTETLTNKTFDANGTGNSLSNVDVADLANGTDGELITWDAAGAPATVATGTSGQVLTSNGAGAAPTFQDAGGGGLEAIRLGGSSTQSIPNATRTNLTGFTVTESTSGTASGWWNTSTNRFTPEAGMYIFYYKVGLLYSGSVELRPTTRVNGSTTQEGATTMHTQLSAVGSSSIQYQTVGGLFVATGSNYLTFDVTHYDTGASRSIDYKFNRTEAYIVKVS